jgi:hypothetical protein
VTTEIIHQLPLNLPVGETVLFVLTVNREQMRGRPLQRGGSDRDVVDPTPAAPGSADLSTQDQGVVGLDAELIEQPGQSGDGLVGKHSLHHQAIVSSPHHIGLRSLPTEQFERLDEQALAGTGFTGEHAEATRKIELHFVDDPETAN